MLADSEYSGREASLSYARTSSTARGHRGRNSHICTETLLYVGRTSFSLLKATLCSDCNLIIVFSNKSQCYVNVLIT